MSAEDDIRRYMDNLSRQRAEAELERGKLDKKIAALENAEHLANEACGKARELAFDIARHKPDDTWRGTRRTRFDTSMSAGGIASSIRRYNEDLQEFCRAISAELRQARLERTLKNTLIGRLAEEIGVQREALEKTVAGE